MNHEQRASAGRLQVPLFAGMGGAPFAEAIKGCLQAILGDVVIMPPRPTDCEV